LDYCAEDVYALEKLLPRMEKHIRIDQALLRGRYMCSVSKMEHHGVPIDVETFDKIQGNFEEIKLNMIEAVNQNFPEFEGTTFKISKSYK
jgi:DNA polymerase-1